MTWASKRIFSVLLLGASWAGLVHQPAITEALPLQQPPTSWTDLRGPTGRAIGNHQPRGRAGDHGGDPLLFPDHPSWIQQQSQKEFAGATAFVHSVGQKNSTATVAVSQTIPLDVVRKLNAIENLTQLFQMFSNNQPEFTPESFLQEDQSLQDSWVSQRRINHTKPRTLKNFVLERFGDVERKAVPFAKPATCSPELQTVEFEKPSDPTMSYYPSCTRVERCGGCCSHELLSCQPIETEMAYFQVIKWQYVGGTKLEHRGKELLKLERHKTCRCGCKVKEQDCNRFQRYDESDCSCVCTNQDDVFKCYAENKTKFWDARDCLCKCREQGDCTTGTYFDQNTCSCILRPHFQSNKAEKFDFQSRNKEAGRLHYSISEQEEPWQLATTIAPTGAALRPQFPANRNRRRRRRRNQRNRNKQNNQQSSPTQLPVGQRSEMSSQE